MAGRRPVRRTQKVLRHVRVYKGEVVTPVRCVSTQAGRKWDIIGGQVGRDGESIKGADGRPLPYKSLGKLVWK